MTHYFDVARLCQDCARPYLFFALEQKYWYEQLGFGLESDCVRCIECRKLEQAVARQRRKYESLVHVEPKTDQQLLETTDAALWLIERDIFKSTVTSKVRRYLKKVSPHARERLRKTYQSLVERLAAVESRG